MKRKLIIPAVSLALSFALALCGCAADNGGEPGPADPQNRDIVLDMSGLHVPSAESRTPVDAWDDTPVGVGYAFAPNTVYDRSLTVWIGDNAGEHVNTGLAYPEDNSVVTFIGYHPAAAPSAAGTVTYDLSKGNVDVMVSNPVSGSLYNTIMMQGDKLVFEHILTRVTFRLQCAPGKSYPEPIFGLRAVPSSTKNLNTAVTFDLAVRDLTFKVSGWIFAGDLEGYVIPLFGNPPVIVEMMVQPDVPLSFIVSSLTGDRNIASVTDHNGLWTELTTQGGRRGKQYTVELSFSGELILAQNISVIPWATGEQRLGGIQDTWW